MSGIALALLLAGLLLVFVARGLRRRTGLPWRRVVYSDAGAHTVDKPLLSRRYGLVGKPDYVLKRGGTLIPVEVKPSRKSSAPYESDLLQLAAYCLLIEDLTGAGPPYGLLRYQHETFQIDWTDALRDELLDVLDALRADEEADDVPRSHDQPGRCRSCGFVAICEEALV